MFFVSPIPVVSYFAMAVFCWAECCVPNPGWSHLSLSRSRSLSPSRDRGPPVQPQTGLLQAGASKLLQMKKFNNWYKYHDILHDIRQIRHVLLVPAPQSQEVKVNKRWRIFLCYDVGWVMVNLSEVMMLFFPFSHPLVQDQGWCHLFITRRSGL